jgi:hypothetical protein
MTQNPAHDRSLSPQRRFQFTLRTFLVVISAACALFAWLAYKPDHTILHRAAKSGDVAQVRKLLDKGYAVDLEASQDTHEFSSDDTPLCVAVYWSQLDVAKLEPVRLFVSRQRGT